ncbi:hypothetical protein EDC04DRAFT_1755829 [Pisolithus marmoratus]|nr:hypothetical protein EDC04DRAFT_1755829 [Pisolithus marmoratus]
MCAHISRTSCSYSTNELALCSEGPLVVKWCLAAVVVVLSLLLSCCQASQIESRREPTFAKSADRCEGTVCELQQVLTSVLPGVAGY